MGGLSICRIAALYGSVDALYRDLMPDRLSKLAAYVSPLTDAEHATIGRIAVLWGQLEFYVEELLEALNPLSKKESKELDFGNMRISKKVRLLRSFSDREVDEEKRSKIDEFCCSIENTRDSRNDIFHGIWGWRAYNRSKEMIPSARKSKNPNDPFRFDRLPDVELQMCQTARIGHRLVETYWNCTPEVRTSRFVHHSDDADDAWMMKWCDENPILSDPKVANPIDGQLTRFERLLPTKLLTDKGG